MADGPPGAVATRDAVGPGRRPEAADGLRRVVVIHNPVAGNRTPHRLVREVVTRLEHQGWDTSLVTTRFRGHATELAAEAVADGVGLVVAAGGDGTINEVLQPLVGTDAVLGVLPVGTVNLWAGEVGLPRDPSLLVRLLTAGERRRVDVGQAGTRYFLLMAGVGFDAAIVEHLGLWLKSRIGRMAYVVAALQQWRGYRGTTVRLTLDDGDEEHDALMLVIGNTRQYAGLLSVTPLAVVDDGLLDICIVRGLRLTAALGQAGALLTRRRSLRSTLLYRRTKAVTIDGARRLPMQLDGDFAGYTPTTIRAVPGGLRVVVPRQQRSGLFRAENALEVAGG